MARVADVRRLGCSGSLGIGKGYAGGEGQQSSRPPLAAAPSRSKAGRSMSSSMGHGGTAAAIMARPISSSQLTFASSIRAQSPVVGGGNAGGMAGGCGPGEATRPSSKGGGFGREWSGPVRFAMPDGNMGREARREAQAEVMEEEDLFDVLQRRIEAQRSELREGRESIQGAMKGEVAELRQAVEHDRRELVGVCGRYREAMDEITRLRGLLACRESSLENALAAAEEAKYEKQGAMDKAEAACERDRGEIARLEGLLEAHSAREGREGALQGALLAAEAALAEVREAAAHVPGLMMRVAEVEGRMQSSAEALSAAEKGRDAASRAGAEVRAKLRIVEEERKSDEDARVRAVNGETAAKMAFESGRKAWDEEAKTMKERVARAEDGRAAAEMRAGEAVLEKEATHAELEALRGELKHREEAVSYAVEQLRAAEAEATGAREVSRELQEHAGTLLGERDAAVAEVTRLAEEAAKAVAELSQVKQQIMEMQQTAGAEHVTVTHDVSRQRDISVVEERKSGGNKVRTSAGVPEGGEVAKGVGVTVNYHSKETLLTLQTTVREKEVILQQITTRLHATSAELTQVKAYWKATQGEASELQRQLRAEKAARRDAESALALATSQQTASHSREMSRVQELERSVASIQAEIGMVRSERDALSSSLGDAERALEAVRGDLAGLEARVLAAESSLGCERHARTDAEARLQCALTRSEDDAKSHASEMDALRRASEEQAASARAQREVLEGRLSQALEDAKSADRMLNGEREAARSRIDDMEARMKREREDSGLREEERARVLAAKRERAVDAKERQFKATVAKLLSSEQAFESSLTCMSCLGIMSNPVTCTPCGHSLCSACFDGGGCAECVEGLKGTSAVPNSALDAICGKYALRIQELAGLQKTLRAG